MRHLFHLSIRSRFPNWYPGKGGRCELTHSLHKAVISTGTNTTTIIIANPIVLLECPYYDNHQSLLTAPIRWAKANERIQVFDVFDCEFHIIPKVHVHLRVRQVTHNKRISVNSSHVRSETHTRNEHDTISHNGTKRRNLPDRETKKGDVTFRLNLAKLRSIQAVQCLKP